MDGSRFDLLTREFATGRSRRGLLKGVLGAAVAAGVNAVRGSGIEAASCRDVGQVCRENANCCSRICGPKDRTGRAYCACAPNQIECNRTCVDPTTAYQSDVKNCGACGNRCPVDQCQSAVCNVGVCGLAPNPARVGRSCDDDNVCTVDDVCQADGTCKGEAKDCSEVDDQCITGVCDPSSGNCVKQPVSDDTDCDDGDLCSTDDSCQNGVCQPGSATICPDRGPCFINPVCDPSSGECEYDGAPSSTTCDVGDENCYNGICCPSARRCPTVDGEVCCPSGKSCSTLTVGEQLFGICCDEDAEGCVTLDKSGSDFVCCPAGVPCRTVDSGNLYPYPVGVCCTGEACLNIYSDGGLPNFEAVCCDSGENCAPLDLSSTPLGSVLDTVELGVCCPDGADTCAEFNLGDINAGISGVCCATGETCQSVSLTDGLSAGMCCATELCEILPLDGDGSSYDAVCCPSDSVCVTIDSLGVPLGRCCPPGDKLLIEPLTYATSCCAEPCLEPSELGSTFEAVCCSDTQQICTPLAGTPPNSDFPIPIGKCCDDGLSVCYAPGPADLSLALTCCDYCQSLTIDNSTLSVCCPADKVPQLETSGGGSSIVCVDPN